MNKVRCQGDRSPHPCGRFEWTVSKIPKNVGRQLFKVLLAGASAATAATLVVSLASPATAGTYAPTCGVAGNQAISGNSQTFNAGGFCTFVTWTAGSGSSASDFSVTVNGSPLASGIQSLITGPILLTYSGSTSGSATVTFEDGSLFSPTTYSYVIAVTGGSGGGGGSSSTSGSSGPWAVTQEFGKPLSGTCDAAQPAGLDWAGVPSGGWAHSWSQWMNGGTGGFVCTRTLVYSTTQSTWVIA